MVKFEVVGWGFGWFWVFLSGEAEKGGGGKGRLEDCDLPTHGWETRATDFLRRRRAMAESQPLDQLPEDLQVMSDQVTQEPQLELFPEEQDGQDLAAAMELSMSAAEGQPGVAGPAGHASEQSQGAVPAALQPDMAATTHDDGRAMGAMGTMEQGSPDPRIAMMQTGLFSTPPSRSYGSMAMAQGMSPTPNFSPPEELPQPQVQAPQ